MGDPDLLQAELAGLRAFAGAAGRASTRFGTATVDPITEIAAAAKGVGHPAGFLELARFGAVARADAGTLTRFADDLTDGLGSTGRAADIAARWYAATEQNSASRLKEIEHALVAGDLPGPAYGDEATVPAGPSTVGEDYTYAPPGEARTNWAALSLDQITSLVFAARPDLALVLAHEWRAVAGSIGVARDALSVEMEPLHWYGQGGAEFHRNVDQTVASTRRWQDSALDRANGYTTAATAITHAQIELQRIVSGLGDNVKDLKLDLAMADSPTGQAAVRLQITAAEQVALSAARQLAASLGGRLLDASNSWQPADRYHGLLGLDSPVPAGPSEFGPTGPPPIDDLAPQDVTAPRPEPNPPPAPNPRPDQTPGPGQAPDPAPSPDPSPDGPVSGPAGPLVGAGSGPGFGRSGPTLPYLPIGAAQRNVLPGQGPGAAPPGFPAGSSGVTGGLRAGGGLPISGRGITRRPAIERLPGAADTDLGWLRLDGRSSIIRRRPDADDAMPLPPGLLGRSAATGNIRNQLALGRPDDSAITGNGILSGRATGARRVPGDQPDLPLTAVRSAPGGALRFDERRTSATIGGRGQPVEPEPVRGSEVVGSQASRRAESRPSQPTTTHPKRDAPQQRETSPDAPPTHGSERHG